MSDFRTVAPIFRIFSALCLLLVWSCPVFPWITLLPKVHCRLYQHSSLNSGQGWRIKTRELYGVEAYLVFPLSLDALPSKRASTQPNRGSLSPLSGL